MKRRGIKAEPPQWALELLQQECVSPKYPNAQTKLVWFNMYAGYNGSGNASPWRNVITCWGDPVKTTASLCLVLHEITHILVGTDLKADTDTPSWKKRMAWHGPAFQAKVIQLYEKYGVLDFAEKWERYKRVRNAITRYKQNKLRPVRIIKKINIQTLQGQGIEDWFKI